jgi:hypothetical protein
MLPSVAHTPKCLLYHDSMLYIHSLRSPQANDCLPADPPKPHVAGEFLLFPAASILELVEVTGEDGTDAAVLWFEGTGAWQYEHLIVVVQIARVARFGEPYGPTRQPLKR